MSAPEDRERRTRRLTEKNSKDFKRRTVDSRKTRIEPYDRDSRHTLHVSLEKGAARILDDEELEIE